MSEPSVRPPESEPVTGNEVAEGAPARRAAASRIDRRRRTLLAAGSATLASGALGLHAPAVVGQAKRFSGVTLNVSCWSANYPRLLGEYVREFTELTGATVNYDTPGFPVFNQRADLELSTRGAGFDVLNITFIFTNRWIGNGWFTPLDPFINDKNKTSPEFDFPDFLPGAVSPLKDVKGTT
ncbi:MAG: extracellular solute-binding protein, partial [Acidobacteria bacterium]|nr:extracellular solute-binding protein [Acidobacteriota bacterium]